MAWGGARQGQCEPSRVIGRAACSAVSHNNAEVELKEKAINWPNAIIVAVFFVAMGLWGEFIDWGLAKAGHTFFIIAMVALFGGAAVYEYRRKRRPTAQSTYSAPRRGPFSARRS